MVLVSYIDVESSLFYCVFSFFHFCICASASWGSVMQQVQSMAFFGLLSRLWSIETSFPFLKPKYVHILPIFVFLQMFQLWVIFVICHITLQHILNSFSDILLFIRLPILYCIARVDINKISVYELYQKMKYTLSVCPNPIISLTVTKLSTSSYLPTHTALATIFM